jgi:hypothetical protein
LILNQSGAITAIKIAIARQPVTQMGDRRRDDRVGISRMAQQQGRAVIDVAMPIRRRMSAILIPISFDACDKDQNQDHDKHDLFVAPVLVEKRARHQLGSLRALRWRSGALVGSTGSRSRRGRQTRLLATEICSVIWIRNPPELFGHIAPTWWNNAFLSSPRSWTTKISCEGRSAI